MFEGGGKHVKIQATSRGENGNCFFFSSNLFPHLLYNWTVHKKPLISNKEEAKTGFQIEVNFVLKQTKFIQKNETKTKMIRLDFKVNGERSREEKTHLCLKPAALDAN